MCSQLVVFKVREILLSKQVWGPDVTSEIETWFFLLLILCQWPSNLLSHSETLLRWSKVTFSSIVDKVISYWKLFNSRHALVSFDLKVKQANPVQHWTSSRKIVILVHLLKQHLWILVFIQNVWFALKYRLKIF